MPISQIYCIKWKIELAEVLLTSSQEEKEDKIHSCFQRKNKTYIVRKV